MNNITHFLSSFSSSIDSDFCIMTPSDEKIYCNKMLLKLNDYFVTYLESNVGDSKSVMKINMDENIDVHIRREHIEEIILHIYLNNSAKNISSAINKHYNRKDYSLIDIYVIVKLLNIWLLPYNKYNYYIGICSRIIKSPINKSIDATLEEKEILFEILQNIYSHKNKWDFPSIKEISIYLSNNIEFVDKYSTNIIDSNILNVFEPCVMICILIKQNKLQDLMKLNYTNNCIVNAIEKYNLFNHNDFTRKIMQLQQCTNNGYYLQYNIDSYNPLTYHVIKKCGDSYEIEPGKKYNPDEWYKIGYNFTITFFTKSTTSINDVLLIKKRSIILNNKYIYIAMKILSIKISNISVTSAKKYCIDCNVELIGNYSIFDYSEYSDNDDDIPNENIDSDYFHKYDIRLSGISENGIYLKKTKT